jgi:hypothetical protein
MAVFVSFDLVFAESFAVTDDEQPVMSIASTTSHGVNSDKVIVARLNMGSSIDRGGRVGQAF